MNPRNELNSVRKFCGTGCSHVLLLDWLHFILGFLEQRENWSGRPHHEQPDMLAKWDNKEMRPISYFDDNCQ